MLAQTQVQVTPDARSDQQLKLVKRIVVSEKVLYRLLLDNVHRALFARPTCTIVLTCEHLRSVIAIIFSGSVLRTKNWDLRARSGVYALKEVRGRANRETHMRAGKVGRDQGGGEEEQTVKKGEQGRRDRENSA